MYLPSKLYLPDYENAFYIDQLSKYSSSLKLSFKSVSTEGTILSNSKLSAPKSSKIISIAFRSSHESAASCVVGHNSIVTISLLSSTCASHLSNIRDGCKLKRVPSLSADISRCIPLISTLDIILFKSTSSTVFP